jgi:hypothetical protein
LHACHLSLNPRDGYSTKAGALRFENRLCKTNLQAVAVLLKYHSDHDPDRTAVRAEIQEIRETLALEKRLGQSFKQVLTSGRSQVFLPSQSKVPTGKDWLLLQQ